MYGSVVHICTVAPNGGEGFRSMGVMNDAENDLTVVGERYGGHV